MDMPRWRADSMATGVKYDVGVVEDTKTENKRRENEGKGL